MIQIVKDIVNSINISVKSTNELIEQLRKENKMLYYKSSDRMTALEFELTSQLSSITKRLDKIESLLYELGVDK